MRTTKTCHSLANKLHLVTLLTVAAALSAFAVPGHAATTNAILFVTQVPMPTEINSRMITGSVVNVSSPFGNHLGDTAACGRGGALWIRYSDGSLANLTQLAGYGTSSGFQGANSIAVREPSVHWSGTKALFSMVVGAPSGPGDTSTFVWQIYEITNFGQGQIPTITKVPNQPTSYNNVSPTYGSDGRIIFASDRPRDGSAHLYPLREEYLQQPTVTGLWSLDPSTGDLFLLEHSPSGSFRPFVDSFGRVIFTRWDHLARDVEAVTDRAGTSTNNVFNYSHESSSALVTTNTAEVFPEPRPSDTNALVGTNMRGNAFNLFLPWQINQDGTAEEVVNHVGRHELLFQIPSATFTNDSNIVTLNAAQRFNTNYVANFFLSHEDPNTPGLLYGIDAIDIGTHTAGQIVTLTAATNINADVMTVGYITPKSTAFPNANGLYRNPLPMSGGLLVAIHATGATTNDFNMGTPTAPLSKYDFRLKTLKQSGGTFVPDQYLTSGFTNTVSYYAGANLITYNGPMWELDPVEVAARPIPQKQVAAVAPIEAQVFADMGVDLPTFQNYLRTNGYALVVSRNVTARDHADKQQPYNLKVAWSGTQTLGTNGTIYSPAYLQLMQADQLRGFKPDGVNPAPGRRVLGQPWHDSVDDNPPVISGPAGSVQLGNDGSMAAIIPARRAMSWQTVDTNGVPIVRERYWVTFQPGEVRTCANCHGVNTQDQAGHIAPTNKPEALKTLLQWWKVVNLPQTPGTIVFQTARDGNHEIYSMNPDGSNATNLTQNPATDVLPRVSYDGKKVVFMSDRGHPGNMDIWTMNNDGSNLFNVTKTNLPGATIWGPALNFDGSKIVYMGPHSPNSRYDLFACNADGTGVTNLTVNTGDGSFPYWSYDGSKIVFGSARDNNTTNTGEEVYIMNANGSGQTRLTFTPGRDFYPVISPNGSKIAFTSERDGHRQIYLMNATDGSGQTNISNNAFNDQNAYFSPDGTRISFTSSRDGGSAEVYVMNADGSGQTRLTSNTVLEAYPAWGNTLPSSPPPPPTFALTVNSGSGSGSYTNGAVVAVAANAPPGGQVFDQWTGATVANPLASSTTLVMPASNTTVTATYKAAPPQTFALTVNSGAGGGSYTNGTVVQITANAPPGGQVFDQWTGATVANPLASSTTLVMPASNTTVTATYKASPPPPPPTFTLTVSSGSGSGSYTNGAVVAITANAPPSGQIFKQWTGATVANPLASSTTLVMPASNTTVTATYQAVSSPGTLQFYSSAFSVNENGSNATIFVTRTDGSNGVVGVSYSTLNGTATAGSDYTATSGTLNWTNGETAAKLFKVTIINDSVYESNETVNLTLGNPTGGATLGSPNTATLTILNDDPAPSVGTLQFSTSSYNVNENGGSVNVAVTRTGGSAGAVGVSYATSNGTATAVSDYTAMSGLLSWTNGETAAKTINLSIVNDNVPEATENFSIALSFPTGGATLGSPSTATISIADDDSPPVGGRIVFTTSRDGNYEIYSMKPDGSNPVNLTHTNATDALPQISLDGSKIAFVSDRGHTGSYDLWVMNSDGSNPVNVTHTNLPGASVWAPSLNADGSKIAFLGPGVTGYNIWVANADGSGAQNLTAGNTTSSDSSPSWSADSTKIVFSSFRDNPTNNVGDEVYIMNADGSGQKRLTSSSGRDFSPVFSPDGTKIAFTSERDGRRQIYLMNADGSNPVNLSKNTFSDQSPCFSPDGTKTGFVSYRDGNYEIYVMNADGSAQTRITTNTAAEVYPSWGGE